MTTGLNIDNLVRVEIDLSPESAAPRGFGILMIVGDSDVINCEERIRTYTGIEEVAVDFGTTAPEYLAAELYFAQSPQPEELFIARWVRTATSALLEGGILTPTEQIITNWDTIIDGTFTISIDGVSQDVTGLDFSIETNLNGVASVISAAMVGSSMTWTGSRFIAKSDTTGITSTISFATPEGTGTDISTQMKLTSTTALSPIDGCDPETPLEATVILSNLSGAWYAETFAASVTLTNTEYLNVAAFIEAETVKRIFCVTETNTLVLDAAYTMDLASEMQAAGYTRTMVQYSDNPYAVCSFFGRAATVDFTANNSTITLMYKEEPSVVPQTITQTQSETLKNKRCNVFVNYINNTAIIQYGVMSSELYFDERHGLDWFAETLQNAMYNLLFTSTTKIPQTNAGQNELVNVATGVCAQSVFNGLVAPGTWNADGFGQLKRGQYLDTGYYVYTESIALQPQAIREQRIAPPIQVAIKLAGAIQEIDCIVNVNR